MKRTAPTSGPALFSLAETAFPHRAAGRPAGSSGRAPMDSAGGTPGSTPRLRDAFSLIEIMVAVALMSVIILGLLAMFSQTQRAFRAGITQVDIMEGGRAALEMIARELEQAAPTRLGGSLNFDAIWNNYYLTQNLPGGAAQTRVSFTQNLRFTIRDNQDWRGIGYSVVFDGSAVGTLYRYQNDARAIDTVGTGQLAGKVFQSVSNRVVDGVVHFRVLAYDRLGRLLTPDAYTLPLGAPVLVPEYQNTVAITRVATLPECYNYQFASNALPAYIDLEIGLLEKKTVDRARNLPAGAEVAYLQKQAGAMQVFRQRIPLRNVDNVIYQ